MDGCGECAISPAINCWAALLQFFGYLGDVSAVFWIERRQVDPRRPVLDDAGDADDDAVDELLRQARSLDQRRPERREPAGRRPAPSAIPP